MNQPSLQTATDSVPLPVEMQLIALQQELDRLRSELDIVRQRDESLHGHMNRLDEELRLAGRVQRDFLPRDLPKVGNVRFHTLFRPAGHVSGDLYDVMRLDEWHVGFYIADAVGHGVPAALLTMFIKNALVTKHIDSTGYRLLSPSETISKLNETIVRQQLSPSTFATAIYGMINTRTNILSFSRGGHPHPILLRNHQPLTDLVADGGLLGVFEDETFQSASVQLHPGDRLMIYSDGLELIGGAVPDKQINPDAWRDHLADFHSLSAEQIIQNLSARIDHAFGPRSPIDDITVLSIDIG